MAKSCNISQSQIKKELTTKALAVAQSVDSKFKVSSIGEIVLLVDSKSPRKDAPYKLRKTVDRVVEKINTALNMDPRKFGPVFGGVTYTDSAAIQVYVTPRLFSAYQVKNQETSIEEVFGPDTYYRPEGFYMGDAALAAQELAELEEDLDLSYLTPPSNTETQFTPIKTAPVQLQLKLSPEADTDKGDLGSIDFKEDQCGL